MRERKEPTLSPSRSSERNAVAEPIGLIAREVEPRPNTGLYLLPQPNRSGSPRYKQYLLFALLMILMLIGLQAWDILKEHPDKVRRFFGMATNGTQVGAVPATRPRVRVNDMAANICGTYEAVARQAVYLRKQGVPISTAESLADSALDLDVRLYRVLVETVQVAYANPAGMERIIDNGQWADNCATVVRGY